MPEERLSRAVFISYRRDVGGILAMALYQHLANHAVDAFYDIESIRAGQFDSIILKQIAARPYFLLVLTPGTLERCADSDDWVRREIEQAVVTQRMIVPVHTPNFDFGDISRFLPEQFGETVRRFNAQELPQRWFTFAVQQLVQEFLLPVSTTDVMVSTREQAVVEEIRQAAHAAPTVTQLQLSAQEYFERALARPEDDLDGAIAEYSEAIRLNPDYAAAFNNRGDVWRTKGDWDRAIADLDEAIRLDPEFAGAFFNRGNARAGQGDLDGAIADFDEGIRLDPADALAFRHRGNLRASQGDLDGAIADYGEAIRLDPDWATAFSTRGHLRVSQGDLDGAIADFSETIRLDPADAFAFRHRGDVRAEPG
jgi:predicted TPR repeat methyltransferase